MLAIYSHSRLNCYEKCPRNYKLQYIDKVKVKARINIEAFLGRRVHEVLEKLYRDLLYGKLDSLEKILDYLHDSWVRNWSDSVVIVKKTYNPEEYLRMAERYISDYYNRYKPFNNGGTTALDERILINLDGYKLVGYIDRLTKADDGCYEIHDYKTCSRLSTLDHLENDRQLALYAIGIKERYPDVKDVRLIWHFLKFDKEIDSIRTDKELKELKRNTIELIDTIENTKVFPANPSRLCSWCKFKPICR